MKNISFQLFIAIAIMLVVSTPWLSYSNESIGQYKSKPGPFQVATVKYDWHDAKRNRDVPVKIYYPKTGSGPFPVIIFSHGLGSSRDGHSYLGEHWASWGYVSVHLQHLGSDDAVWKGNDNPGKSMKRAADNPKNAIERPLDVSFAIDQMEKLNVDNSPFKGRLDLKNIGMAGHSFGSHTTLVIAGQLMIGLGKEKSFADPRVKAAIAMSSPASRKSKLDKIYSKIKIPVFHMTGTKDMSPINDTNASERRIPFDHIKRVDQYLLIFKNGDHMVFSGRARNQGNGENDALFQNLICQSSTAFWDTYLKNDSSAKSWLAGGGFEKELDGNGSFEKKN